MRGYLFVRFSFVVVKYWNILYEEENLILGRKEREVYREEKGI